MAKHKRTSSTSTATTSNSSHSRPLTEAAHHPLVALAHLTLRSVALLSVLAAALILALSGWAVLRKATAVPLVRGRERVWLQYGEWRPPYATLELDQKKYAVRGQRYDLSLELSVPVNENNVELGNFMVSLSLLDGEGERVVNVSRPVRPVMLRSPFYCAKRAPVCEYQAILAHPSHSTSSPPSSSSFLSLLNPATLFRLPLSLFSFSTSPSLCAQKTQTLIVPLLEDASLSSPPARKRGWASRRRVGYEVQGIQKMWVEVGRMDAHKMEETGEGKVRELQVYESYLRVETKLRGLRSIVHTHPYLSFLFFFPSFVLLELLAALLVYTSYVLKPDSTFSLPAPFSNGSSGSAAEDVLSTTNGPSRIDTSAMETGVSSTIIKQEEEDGDSGSLTEGGSASSVTGSQEDEDVKPLLSPYTATLDLPSSTDESEGFGVDLDPEQAEHERARRMRLGRGGKGMSEVAPPSSGEELEEEVEESEEAGEEGVIEELERVEEAEMEAVEGKEEDDDATVGGSETTARTRSTFGPMSIATGTTASSSSSGLRSRAAGGGGRKE
ncbi:hypothetical protein JCM11251_002268 [Rhodosporidiobolus azoricus]